jgi:Domain of unknown function (DUF4249)
MKIKITYVAIAALSLASCEKVINVDLKNAEPKIVIEGVINNSGDPAKVTISKSVSFSIPNTFPPVTGAVVKVSDNAGNNYTLKENGAGNYTNASLIGVEGRTYNLSITAEGKNYTASCKMPPQVNLDSVFQEKLTFTRPLIAVNALFDDPKGFGNNYQFIETINGKRNKTIFILDDLYQDGGTISNQLIDEDAKLKAGDVVQIEMQCVDKNIYRYLRGLEDLQFNNSVPANPESNITNNALGYFSAHTSQKQTITIR